MTHGGARFLSFGRRRLTVVAFALLVLLTGMAGPAGSPARSFPARSLPTASGDLDPSHESPSELLYGTSDLISAAPMSSIEAELGLVSPPAHADLISIDPTALVRPHTVVLEVTAYCSCRKCCGSHARGMTASGKPVTYNNGKFVAADTKVFRYGSKLRIPGYDDEKPVEVIDRGGAIKGYHIDVFMPTHQDAVNWGKKKLSVTVE